MQYGHFSKDGKEYVITKPNTPRPWFNYLFNDTYHALVSQSGGGFSYYKDPKTNRILRYDHLSTDRPGRYVFIRDVDKKESWSLNWQPSCEPLDKWQAVHGLGYSKIFCEQNKISGEITYLVPQKGSAEIWLVKIKNNSNKKRNLKVFPFVEFVSGDIELEACYRNIIMLYNEAYFDKKLKAIVAFKHRFKSTHKEGFSFFATSLKVKGYDTQKEKFYGRYNDVTKPETILSKGRCANTHVRGEDMVGVLEADLRLGPREEKEFVVVLGFADDKTKISAIKDKFMDVGVAKKELAQIGEFWNQAIERIKVQTPDPNFDLMVNIWGKYQLCAITHWRGTSQYHGVEGGLGYRDTAQDAEGLFALDPALGKKKMEKILQYQYSSGHAVSGFSDTEGAWDLIYQSGVIGKADVAVWLPYCVVSYIKETGDTDFLKREYRFCDGSSATVYEHILRAVRYLYKTRGSHGLPLIFKADWNDAYDHVGLKGKGESVWLGMALCRAARQIGELADFLGDREVVDEMQKIADELSKIINTEGWDGEWYLAAFNDEGYKIGSKENDEGNVPLNSQTWAILSEVSNQKDRLKRILDKIDNYLDTAYGPALFLPSYTKFNPDIGRVTAFAEGTKENAAVFSHACAFKIVSDCFIKRGDKAYETFAKLMPMNPAKKDHDKYKVEPYVWAEYIIGPGSDYRFGEGAFTWNTGTSPWMFTAATEWILGARREFEGLLIDPCLPHKWKECFIRRPFRDAVYEVYIRNPEGLEWGVKEITLDGKKIKGNLIKPHSDGKVHKVEVLMGTAAVGPRSRQSPNQAKTVVRV
jgi:cellobiose phosphorylase